MLKDKNFEQYPKFIHNLWTHDEAWEHARLTVSHGKFDVPKDEAFKFFKVRSHCTGHNTVEEVAARCGLPVKEVQAMIKSLAEAQILHKSYRSLDSLTREEILRTLQDASRIWSEQLNDTYIGTKVFAGNASRNVSLGWLLENYHYVKAFPAALEVGARAAQGPLRDLIARYAREERGHEEFTLKTLIASGLTREEVVHSIPLVSTRAIDFLLRELFEFEPTAVLLVAAIIEAHDFDAGAIGTVKQNLHARHGFPLDALDPFFEHSRIDAQLGHAKLFHENSEMLLDTLDRGKLHQVINKIHDLKHAFDLQSLEIEEYYSKNGNYFPRQFVDFFAI